MKNLLITRISLGLLFFGGLQNLSAAQVPALSDQIAAGQTVAQVINELVKRIHENTATVGYLQACLDFGVGLNQLVDQAGTTLLMVAVQEANIPLVNLLLELGADPDIADVSGNTALFYVPIPDQQQGNEESALTLIDLLWQKGADLNKRDAYEATILMQAVGCEKLLSDLIIKNVDLDAKDQLGMTALINSLGVHPSITTKLIRSGVSLDLQTDMGRTALMVAACRHLLAHMNELIFAGANPLLKDKYGSDALALFENPAANINARLSAQRKAEVDAMQKLLSRYCKLYAQYGKDIALKKLQEHSAAESTGDATVVRGISPHGVLHPVS